MKISIIIPAYNCQQYIKKCLDSILSQTGVELDVVVVNDGSTDCTEEILLQYQGAISFKTTSNQGSSAARNQGIQMACGDYIMFVDADDYLEPGALKRLSDILIETKADIVKFRYRHVFPDQTFICDDNQFDRFDLVEKPDFKTKIYPFFISGIRLNSMCSGIYRSRLIKGRKFREDMRVAEDAVFALGTYTMAESVAIIPDVLYNYYQTGTGLTGSGVKILQKYHCNFLFAAETAKLLKQWGMNSPLTYLKVYVRPLFLTFDKIKRIMRSQNRGKGGGGIGANET